MYCTIVRFRLDRPQMIEISGGTFRTMTCHPVRQPGTHFRSASSIVEDKMGLRNCHVFKRCVYCDLYINNDFYVIDVM